MPEEWVEAYSWIVEIDQLPIPTAKERERNRREAEAIKHNGYLIRSIAPKP